ncbi:hypothetical protein HPP92_001885 [Vanilla planifolia]|uniref:Uncharacterized protein n=1 Tax=Vanilla planifolia TaxID=51239 RepID=A0A835SDL8_VANPL|nr:hypothetical protein HPP92_001885 [Vanilla planifolia]
MREGGTCLLIQARRCRWWRTALEEDGDLIRRRWVCHTDWILGYVYVRGGGGLRERFRTLFHFAGGGDVVLKPTNAFTEPTAEGTVCLAMQATNGTG